MYNSIIVRYLVKLWDFFSGYYEKSFVKKATDAKLGFLRYIFKGSVVKDVFTSDKSLIDFSFFYKIYSWLVDIINKILKIINLSFKRLEVSSIFFSLISGFNKSFNKVIDKTNIKEILLDSIIFKFIISLFSADEVGDQWW
ncbi:hypothetical protein E9840_03790 [Tissierella creatinini]|nr:hypothetical protein E9840_03790 [Tissierella creatinini]TJX67408.1 hypothetical protein E8P77_05510 [Soehngenia saccharolytica]